ncbi:inorganic diphosphatase [Shigella flexneri]
MSTKTPVRCSFTVSCLPPGVHPCNYGYINHTLSLDGDPVDVLVPTPYPFQLSALVIRCRPVGVLK